MFIEVERKDGRKARLRVDHIASVLEDSHASNGLSVPILTLQVGSIKVECINENMHSLFVKMTAATGRGVNCVRTSDIDEQHRAPRSEEFVAVTEVRPIKRAGAK